MHALWLLPAKVLAALINCVWLIKRTETRQPFDTLRPIPQPAPQLVSVPESRIPTRPMKWISIGELMALRAECSDLVVIDLRADAKRVPFPVPNVSVIPVAQNELTEVLERLPADQSVAFCGASDLSIFLIATSHCLEGSAPFYVLEGDLSLAEVA